MGGDDGCGVVWLGVDDDEWDYVCFVKWVVIVVGVWLSRFVVSVVGFVGLFVGKCVLFLICLVLLGLNSVVCKCRFLFLCWVSIVMVLW